jgi:hypothetical protein
MRENIGSHALLGIRLGACGGGRGRLVNDVGIRHVSRVMRGNLR